MRLKTKLTTKAGFLDSQPCITSFRKAKLPKNFRQEIERFIRRNKLKDCGRVPPNCLKAHMVKTAKKLNIRKVKIDYLKQIFKSRIGYKGYYLDNGKLSRV